MVDRCAWRADQGTHGRVGQIGVDEADAAEVVRSWKAQRALVYGLLPLHRQAVMKSGGNTGTHDCHPRSLIPATMLGVKRLDLLGLAAAALLAIVCVASVGWVLANPNAVDQGWRATMAGWAIAVLSAIGAPASLFLANRKARARRRQIAEYRRQQVVTDLPVALPDELLASRRPSDLLSADRQLTPFRGRSKELQHIRNWCLDPEAPRFFSLTGPSMVGKTRLVIQLAADGLGPGWRISRLRPGHGSGAVAAIQEMPGRHLVVVEIAEVGRTVRDFISDVASIEQSERFRVILIARSPIAVPRPDAEISRALLEAATTMPGGAIVPYGSINDLTRWHNEAYLAFCSALGTEHPKSQWVPNEAGTPMGLVITRALADAFGDSENMQQIISDHETAQWPLPQPSNCGEAVLTQRWFTAAWLRGSATFSEIEGAVSRLSDGPDTTARIVAWLLVRLQWRWSNISPTTRHRCGRHCSARAPPRFGPRANPLR